MKRERTTDVFLMDRCFPVKFFSRSQSSCLQKLGFKRKNLFSKRNWSLNTNRRDIIAPRFNHNAGSVTLLPPKHHILIKFGFGDLPFEIQATSIYFTLLLLSDLIPFTDAIQVFMKNYPSRLLLRVALGIHPKNHLLNNEYVSLQLYHGKALKSAQNRIR